MELISYAQNFEDIRLWRTFRDIEHGRYLDIGTQDPLQDSVSRLFYERGWRGVHVEPTAHYAEAMRKARPDEQVVEAAVSSSSVPLKFFEIPETGLSTGISSIAEFHQKAGWTFREILVPTITLASLFDYMGEEPIHWLKIDVEGMEPDVLASWGDHPARPLALVVEATKPSTQEPSHHAWHELVTQRGYHEVAFDGLSRYFIHGSEMHRGEALALTPNVFDGFQVLPTHFSAGRMALEAKQHVAALRSEAEAQAEAHAQCLAEAVSSAAEASAELEAALKRAGELENRIASDAESYAQALDQAHAAAAAAKAELDDARQALEEQAATEAANLAEARSQAADAQTSLDDARRKVAALQHELAVESAAHADTKAQAAAAAANLAAKLDLADALARELQLRLEDQARHHGASLELAKERIDATQRALAETAAQLHALQAENRSLGREAGRLEGQLDAQKQRYAADMADAAARQQDFRDRLDSAERELAAMRDLAADLRVQLAVQIAQSEAAAAATAAEKKAASALLDSVREEARRLEERASDLAGSLTGTTRERDAFAAQVEKLSLDRAKLVDSLYAIEKEAAEAREQANQLSEQAEVLTARLASTNDERDAFAKQLEGALSERANLAEALETARQQAAETGLALQQEIESLRRSIALREGRIAQAERLLAGVPDPMSQIYGLRGVLVRRLIGTERLSTFADHAAAAQAWRQDGLQSGPAIESSIIGSPLDCASDVSHGRATTSGASMLSNEGSVTSVAQLLALHDRAFVHAAYHSLLGRAPDAEGEAYYLARLRAGVHKLAILRQFRRSPEGVAFVPAVAGLDRAIKRHHQATLPFVGLIVRLFTGAEGNGATHRNLRILVNEINCLKQMQLYSEQAIDGLSREMQQASSRVGHLERAIEDLMREAQRAFPGAHPSQPNFVQASAPQPQVSGISPPQYRTAAIIRKVTQRANADLNLATSVETQTANEARISIGDTMNFSPPPPDLPAHVQRVHRLLSRNTVN